MDKNEKKNQLFKCGTTWCSAADCFNNKIADPSIVFFRFPKDQRKVQYATHADYVQNTSMTPASAAISKIGYMRWQYQHYFPNCQVSSEDFLMICQVGDMQICSTSNI